MTIEIMCDGT